MNKSTKELGTLPITKLLMKFSIPAIVAMVINAIYNIVDRIFVAQYVGEEALAGLTIAFPIMLIAVAIANMIGQGGANLISLKLGEGEKKEADHIYTNTITMTILISAIIIAVGILNLEQLLTLLGAEAKVLEYGINYLFIIFLGFMFQLLAFVLNCIIRSEGFPVLSMQSMIISGVVNMVLDYVFIALMGMGVEGAALATVIGQFTGVVMLLLHFAGGKSSLHIHKKDIIPDLAMFREITKVGSAAFIATAGASLSMMVLNKYLVLYGGTGGVASMGAINSLYTLFIMPILGIQSGIQPIIGFNYGAGFYKRVKETLYKAIFIGSAFSSAVFLIMELWPQFFLFPFLDTASGTMEMASYGLRLYIAILPFLSINLFGTAYYQAIAKSSQALILGSLRQVLFLIPIVVVMAKGWGLNGVWLSTPIADALAVLATLIFLVKSMKKLSYKEKKKEELSKLKYA